MHRVYLLIYILICFNSYNSIVFEKKNPVESVFCTRTSSFCEAEGEWKYKQMCVEFFLHWCKDRMCDRKIFISIQWNSNYNLFPIIILRQYAIRLRNEQRSSKV